LKSLLKGDCVKRTVLIAFMALSLAAYSPATCFLDFLDENIPDQTVNVAMSFQLQACCGTTPYTFSLYSGSFPAGLSMSSSGLISGTPTTVGYTTPCITLTDAVGCHTTRCYEIHIN
jgi:hypothetical protein